MNRIKLLTIFDGDFLDVTRVDKYRLVESRLVKKVTPKLECSLCIEFSRARFDGIVSQFIYPCPSSQETSYLFPFTNIEGRSN